MSQDTKGRTRIGTLAPTTHPRPPGMLGHDQPTIIPIPTTPGPSMATVAMRPRAEPAMPVAPAMPAYGEADMFIGQELCGYTIRRKLAEGGMGVVYEGAHTKIGRLGAIKVLKLEFCRSEDVVERFYQEARAVNSIRHENIVDIYDFGRDAAGRVFFVMEYLEGEPLSTRIRRGALTWPEAFPILEQTLRALKAAHDKGFVHRDLKPDNIWLRYVDGRVQVKLLDFGIAKLVGSESPREKLTQTGSVIGTPHYMSPEQINGSKDIDQRTDLYALGVITYEMFAGVTPFVGDTLQAIMTGHLFREPPRLADIPTNLGVPAQIAEIIDRMLVKDATGRYDSVGEVLDDLYDVNGNRWPTHAGTMNQLRPTRGPTLVQPPPVAPAPARKSRRGVVIGLVALAGLAGGGVAIWQSQKPAPAPAVAITTPPTTATTAPKAEPATKPAPPPPIDEAAVRANAQTVLRAALHEAEPIVRVQGSDAVGAVKDPLAIPDLTKMTETDADADVRGHSAGALGAIGATTTAALLGKLETSAAPPLKVWYASALARLGDQAAIRRLLTYARNPDLAVAFQATIALAEVSQPGDQKTLGALRAIAAHEAELNAIQPYAGALILSKMAALRDADARKLLYGILAQPDEGARLAAAEGLAKLGDDAGRALLHDIASKPGAPNQLVAAVVQIALGEYGGVEVITKALAAKDPDTRRLAARALGDVGEKTALPALLALAGDKDWTVRIAVARAIVAIVGIDQQVLAQASVDWTRSALTSQDWATRKAAAGVLADIPTAQAVPLLAQAIADHNPAVRLAASKSAGKIKSAEAAAKVVAAVDGESDAKVKEQQIKALGEIGTVAGPAAHDTLAKLSEAHSRLGVLAAGSLLSVGDTAGTAKLERAVAASSPSELRLAAVEAASATSNPLVVPTLKLGVLDKIFGIKFLAAEGLATMNVEKDAALPVLTEALASKDADVVGRAMAALTRFGEQIKAAVRTPAEMIDSPDPKQRLAAIPIVRAMPASDGVPLLRRLVVDPDAEVRHAGVDAIESVVTKDKEAAKRLYKPLVKDADPVVASKAAGQLSRLIDPPVITASAKPAAGDALPKVQIALDTAKATSAETVTARQTFDALAADFATTVAGTKREDATIAHVGALPASLDKAAIELDALANKLALDARAVADSAGASPSPAAARLVAEAQALATTAREAATAARGKTAAIAQEARRFLDLESDGVQRQIASADAAIAAGNFALAQQKLDAAAKRMPPGKRNANLDYSYATLYQRKANATTDPEAHAKLLQQATAAYTRVVQAGGPLVPKATGRIAEIGDETKAGP